MLYELLIALFVFLCIFMILLILIQKGKSSTGLGALGGGTQLLFGGSQGQDLFQKITWALGAIFMAGSLMLAMIKRPSSSDLLQNIARAQAPEVVIPKQPAAAPVAAPAESAQPTSETKPEAAA